jgi:hypothetical protein
MNSTSERAVVFKQNRPTSVCVCADGNAPLVSATPHFQKIKYLREYARALLCAPNKQKNCPKIFPFKNSIAHAAAPERQDLNKLTSGF